jgi:uncharacterized protein YbcI
MSKKRMEKYSRNTQEILKKLTGKKVVYFFSRLDKESEERKHNKDK